MSIARSYNFHCQKRWRIQRNSKHKLRYLEEHVKPNLSRTLRYLLSELVLVRAGYFGYMRVALVHFALGSAWAYDTYMCAVGGGREVKGFMKVQDGPGYPNRTNDRAIRSIWEGVGDPPWEFVWEVWRRRSLNAGRGEPALQSARAACRMKSDIDLPHARVCVLAEHANMCERPRAPELRTTPTELGVAHL